MARILYIEDEPTVAKLFTKAMVLHGHEVDVAGTGQEGLDMHAAEPYELLAVDYQLPDMTGMDVCRVLLMKDRDLPIVMITGHGNQRLVAEALGLGVSMYVEKDDPEVYIELLPSIVETLERRRDERREKREAEIELRASENLMRQLLNTTQEGYWFIDNEGLTKKVNPAMCDILGRPEADIIGKSVFDFVDEDNAEILRREIAEREKGVHGTYEIDVCRADGINVRCINNATAVFDEHGVKIGSVGLFTNVQALTDAVAVAEEASKAKSSFLSSMSHELRTPLNAIIGFAQLLEFNPKEPLTETQKTSVSHIKAGGDHLLSLINDILDLARIEAGQVDLSIEHLYPRDIFKECLELLRGMADERQITLDGKRETECGVRADYVRLKQVLINLLSNAIKYNRDGGSVQFGCIDRNDHTVRIYVTDTGDGIPEEKLPELFEPFSRLGKETSEIEGTGIGLTVSKQLVELMGGEIGCESEVGKGSTFWVEFQKSSIAAELTDSSKDIDPASPLHHVGRGTILYVEDNPANRELMENIVANINGVSLIMADSAEAGLEMAKDRKIDLILMDINLPGMSGIEAFPYFRELDGTRDVPAVVVSAAATKVDIEKGLDAGFVKYLTKPIKVSEITEIIVEFLPPTKH